MIWNEEELKSTDLCGLRVSRVCLEGNGGLLTKNM